MYVSVAYALRKNGTFLYSTSRAYREDVKKAKQKTPKHEEDAGEINFAICQTARQVYACENQYRMPATLTEEISFMQKILIE